MKKATLLIAPLMSPLLSIHASELPDEINFSPYERVYQTAATNVEIISVDLEQAKNQLSNAYTQEANLTREIQQTEDNIYRTQNIIAENRQEKNRLINIANALDSQIQSTSAELSKTDNRRQNLERQFHNESERLKPLQEKIRQLTRTLEQLNNQLKSEQQKLQKQKANLTEAQQKLSQLNQQISSLETKIQEQKQRLANLEKEIKAKNNSIAVIEPQLVSAQNKQAQEKAKLDEISRQIAKLNQRLRALGSPDNPEIAQIKKQLEIKRQERKVQAEIYTAANTQVESLKGKLASEKNALSKLETQKQNLPSTIAKNEQTLAQNKTQVTNTKQRIQKLTNEISTQQTTVDNLIAQIQQTTNRLRQSEQQLAQDSQQLEELRIKLTRVNNRVRELGESLKLLQRDYRVTSDKIAAIERALPGYRRDLSNLQRNLQVANVDLVNVQNQIIVLNTDVNRLTSQLSSATTDRDIKYQEYITRLRFYNEMLAEAKKLGASQTDAAFGLARTDSDIKVEQQAFDLGAQIGLQLAQAQGSYWSSIRAEIKGYNDGYQIGYASQDDQSRGEQAGTIAGIKAAQHHAQTVMKPDFFNTFFEEALKTSLFKVLSPQKSTPIPYLDSHIDDYDLKNNNELIAAVSPITISEISESQNISSDLDQNILRLKKNLEQTQLEQDNLSKPRNVYQTPTQIPYQTFDCSQVYKELNVFKQACSEEYYSVFAYSYKSEFYANFEAQYKQLFEAKLSEIRNDNIESVYSENFKEFYPIAQAGGISDGKEQIYQETFALAKEQAYSEELPRAQAVAKAQASDEVKSWINNNPALTIVHSEITDTDLRGGSLAKVAIALKNISPIASQKPIKLIIEKTANVHIDQKEIFLADFPGHATSTKKDLIFKISPQAKSGDTINISGKIILPGGKYNTQRIETFSVSAQTSINPNLAPQVLTYDSSPKVKGLRRYNIHRFDIEITPAIETIKEGYTIEMVPLAHADVITMKTASKLESGKLTFGQTQKVSFKYVFTKAARDKIIPMKINYIFQGKIMRSETIELKPH